MFTAKSKAGLLRLLRGEVVHAAARCGAFTNPMASEHSLRFWRARYNHLRKFHSQAAKSSAA